MILAETTKEEDLQMENVRLAYRAEALEAELAKALDLSRARAERAGYNRRIAQLEAELGAAAGELRRRTERIAEMDAELHRRDREHWRMAGQIQTLDAALVERDRRIRRMRTSLVWRLGAPIRVLENWLA